jgi:uncharacterized protein (DUF697 family)
MHDLDRQQLEQYEGLGELSGELGLELSEAQELALASEILEVTSEEELEQFLGDLWRRTKAAATSAYNSPAVQSAIPALKTAGRSFLPAAAGQIADRYYPGSGPMVSAGAQMLADQWLKEELEGLSNEDRELEVARRFVRFANQVLQRAAQAPARVPPRVAAQAVVRDTARDLIPGLVPFVGQLFRSASDGSARNQKESQMSTFESYEMGQEAGPFEVQESYGGPFETFEGPFESSYETYEGEDEQFLGSILGALTGEYESPLSESQEMELAAEVLEITSEEELEEFLGNVLKGVAKGVGGFIRSPIAKQLGGVLKSVAKKALPMVGGALGSFIAPGVGTAIGSKLGSMASGLFELETEGMNQEQLEFEMARRYVRLAATSARQAALAPPNVPARRVVQSAVTQAARQHAPGLLRGTRGMRGAPQGRAAGRGQAAYQRGGRGARPRQAPLGAVAYPVGSSNVYVPTGNGQAADGSPWGDAEPGGDDGSYQSQQGRTRSGRWYRRGRKVVLVGI